MDTFASYFDYAMMCVCGIPKITIEGSLDDWQRIRARVEVLSTYELEWWVSRLRPILDEFVLTAGGYPTPEFWKAIYKPEKAYGDEGATGWITDLFLTWAMPPPAAGIMYLRTRVTTGRFPSTKASRPAGGCSALAATKESNSAASPRAFPACLSR